MANFEPTHGIANFITSPDFIKSVIIRNASEEQIVECMEACRESGRVINVYVQTPAADESWILNVEYIADDIIDAEKMNPVDYFTK